MSALEVSIAEAVKDAINGAAAGTFGKPFKAVRLWLPEIDRKELRTLKAYVVPMEVEAISAASRGKQLNDSVIGVTLMQSLPKDEFEKECDALAQVLDEVHEFLWKTAGQMAGASVVGITKTFRDDDLRSNQFTGELAATYRRIR